MYNSCFRGNDFRLKQPMVRHCVEPIYALKLGAVGGEKNGMISQDNELIEKMKNHIKDALIQRNKYIFCSSSNDSRNMHT